MLLQRKHFFQLLDPTGKHLIVSRSVALLVANLTHVAKSLLDPSGLVDHLQRQSTRMQPGLFRHSQLVETSIFKAGTKPGMTMIASHSRIPGSSGRCADRTAASARCDQINRASAAMLLSLSSGGVCSRGLKYQPNVSLP